MTASTATWRQDIESLSFRPAGHDGDCVVHRLVFRTLLGFSPEPAHCEMYFLSHRPAFERAAAAKIQRACLPCNGRFHLNSRDLRRALLAG